MRVLIRRGGARSRSPAFAASGLLHAAAFLSVVLSAAVSPRDPRPVYNLEIRPYEAHIIWYNLRDKLPEIKPAEPVAQAAAEANRTEAGG